MTRLVLCGLLALALTLSLTHAADWPRFRGPNGSGTADGPLPTIDPAKPLWKVAIPGRGVSSPIVVNGKIYLQSGSDDGTKRMMFCLDPANGQPIWVKEVPGKQVGVGNGQRHVKNSLASGTPACDGEMVFGAFWDGSAVSLHAFDAKTGDEKWSASLGGYVSQHGPGFSPVIHNGLVYVNVDDDEHAEFIAFDAKTGAKKWAVTRKHHRASYTSPFILERPGKPAELLLATTTAITAYEPATGKEVWSYSVPWAPGQMVLRMIGHPVYCAGLLVCYFGDGGGARYMVAIDPEKPTPAKVWDANKDTPYVPCLLVKGDLLFWITDKPGNVCCTEAKTGKILWKEKAFDLEVTSSPLMMGDEILTISEGGDIHVFKATRKYDPVTTLKLGQRVYASPAAFDGKVLIRGDTHLFCFGKK